MRYEWVEIRPYIGVFLCVFNTLRDRMGERSGYPIPEKGKQTEQGRQQRETAVAILNVGGGDDAVQQQALRIDQNMPLLALDQLAGIEAVAVDASPPFSALFTL